MSLFTLLRLATNLVAFCGAPFMAQTASAATVDCTAGAAAECYFTFTPSSPTAGMHATKNATVHYYASMAPTSAGKGTITHALIAMHGHPRDANKTFDAALASVKGAQVLGSTLVVAPVYQVASADAKKCSTPGVPVAQEDDLLWTCASWLEGGGATNAKKVTSFKVMDALVAELRTNYPNLQTITIAGFSAGAQMVQHYVAFAADLGPNAPKVRYVVSDPGTWLYFDPVRAQPYLDGRAVAWSACSGGAQGLGTCELKFELPAAQCTSMNTWKYGLEKLPHGLGRDAKSAREHYASADVQYMEGSLDSNDAGGTFYGVLDKSCAAESQGPYRMQRGVVYAAYDRAMLAPGKRRSVTIVPGCAHDVACVFASKQAQAVLLPE